MVQIVYDSSINLSSFHIQSQNLLDCNLEQTVRNHLITINKAYGDLDFYLVQNGRIIRDDILHDASIYVIPRIRGGKGGFGSMLRAIGAQIEKTTNREACRDLSGRRLRDINEEKRLKKWIAEQADREREAAEKKKRKLEKLCAEPRHEFVDEKYDKTRSEMTEKVFDAVEQGLKVATTSSTSEPSTSKPVENNSQKAKKKAKGCLWVDDLDDSLDSCDSESEDESPAKKRKIN